MNIIRIFLSKKFSFFVVKFSIYLNRQVFVMVVVSNVGRKRVDCILEE